MKKYILLLVAVLATMVSFGQVDKDQKSPCDIELVAREYPVVFASFEDQSNFSKLTDFIKRRETQLKDFVAKTGSGKILISSNSLKSIVEELTTAKLSSTTSISSSDINIRRIDSLIKNIDDTNSKIVTVQTKYNTTNDEKNKSTFKGKLDSLNLIKDKLEREITQFTFERAFRESNSSLH